MPAFDFIVVALLFVAVILMLAVTRLRPIAVFGGVAWILYASGVLTLESLSHNYVNPSLLTLISLLLLSVVLEKVSFVSSLSRHSVTQSQSVGRGVFRLGFVAGVISSFLNNTAVVATLMGGLRRQSGLALSRYLLPLSYASIAGGMMTLVGTSTNLIVNSFVEEAGEVPLGFFDFTLIGAPVFVATLLAISLVSHRLLPDHKVVSESQERRQYLFERVVAADSGMVGKTVSENALRRLESMFLAELVRGDKVFSPVDPDFILQAGDVLVFAGDPRYEHILSEFNGLSGRDYDDGFRSGADSLVEVVVSPTSSMIGASLKSCEFRSRFGAAVIAIRRGSKNIRGNLGNHVLQAGDSLLLTTGDKFISSKHESRRDFVTISGIERRQSLSALSSVLVMGGFGLAIALSVMGVIPLLKGILLLLGACLAFRLVSLDELKNRFPFELIIVIGGALGLSQAMFEVGLASMLAAGVEHSVGALGPYAALVLVYIVTWLVTELVTNNAAAALMFPVAYASAEALGVSPYPFFMALAFAASASFLSPYGYQTNLMVYGAGNYCLTDYIRAGLAPLIAYSVAALALIPVAFPFWPT